MRHLAVAALVVMAACGSGSSGTAPAVRAPDAPPAAVPPPTPIAAQPVTGAAGDWIGVGPGGGPVREIAVEADDAQVALAATQVGLFRSADGGQRWTPIPSTSAGIAAVTFSPADPKRAYAMDIANHVFTSTDGGATWTSTVDLIATAYVHHLVGHPAQANTVFAATEWGLYVSRDAGGSWSLLFKPAVDQGEHPSICSLAIDPLTPSRLFAASCGGNFDHLYRSLDGGATWTPAKTGFGSFTAVTIDPAAPDTVYAALEYAGGQVTVSRDGGATFMQDNSFGNLPFRALTLDLGSDGSLYAGLNSNGAAVSHDGGATFALFSQGLPAGVGASLALHPSARKPYLAAVRMTVGGGVYRVDGNGAWTRRSSGLFAETASGVAWTSSGSLVVATDSGTYKSDDGGATYGSMLIDGWASSVAVDAQDTIYVSTEPDLRVSSDGGKTWTTRPSSYDGNLVADPHAAGSLYRFGMYVSHTSDGGQSWTALTDPTFFSALAVDGGKLYVWSRDLHRPDPRQPQYVAVNPGLRMSTDGGRSFSPPQALGATDCAGIAAGGGHAFAALLTKDAQENVTGSQVVRTDDGGATWTKVLSRTAAINGIAMIGSSIAVSLTDATLRSDDLGATWKQIGAGNPAIRALFVSPGGALYAGTEHASLLRLTPAN